MGILKRAPPPLASAEELVAMACAMEREAARRYRNLAARMRLRDEERLAGIFDFFAGIEEKHALQIDQRYTAVTGRHIEPTEIRWEVPENFDDEEAESHLLTPYRALAVAVRNEERAFSFYSYVAAGSRDDRVRKIAEDLARDELTHAWLLRRERRKAYRAEAPDRQRHVADVLPGSLAELWIAAAKAEWRAARYHRELAASLKPRDGAAAALFSDAALDEAACACEAAQHVGFELVPNTDVLSPTVAGGLLLLEEAFERYADIAERTRDEDVLRQAQSLAQRAVRRLSLLRGGLNARH
jgi:rubrerythrin